jgi:hypothetical protein
MKTETVINEIIKSKKERFKSSGVPEYLYYLLYTSNLKNWNNFNLSESSFWIENFTTTITDKPIVQGVVRKNNIEYDTFLIELYICRFRLEITQEFKETFSSFFFDTGKNGKLFLYHNDLLVCQLGIKQEQEMFIKSYYFTDVEGFIEGDWVDDLENLVERHIRFKSLIDEHKRIEKEKDEPKNKFGVTDSEIEEFVKNTSHMNKLLIYIRNHKFLVGFISLLVINFMYTKFFMNK